MAKIRLLSQMEYKTLIFIDEEKLDREWKWLAQSSFASWGWAPKDLGKGHDGNRGVHILSGPQKQCLHMWLCSLYSARRFSPRMEGELTSRRGRSLF